MTQAPTRPQSLPGRDRRWIDHTGQGSAAIVPRQRPAHLGVLHVLQLVAVELAVLAVLAALASPGGGPAAAVPVALGGLLVAGVTLTRRRGRWLLETLLLDAHLRRRRGITPDPGEPDPRLAALRHLAPRLTVQDVDGPNGTRIGVGYDGEGWFAAVVVAPPDGLSGDSGPGIGLAVLAQVLDRRPQTLPADPGQVGAAVQVVTLTVPAPHPGLDAQWPTSRSYLELLGATGPGPAERVTWVAVRIEARTLAETGAGDPDGSATAPPALTRLVRRTVKTLHAAGLPVRVLDAAGLLDALAHGCDLAPTQFSAGAAGAAGSTGAAGAAGAAGSWELMTPLEERGAWRSGSLSHATFWLQEWPQPAAVPSLLDALAAVPGAMTSVAVRIMAEPSQLRGVPPGGGTTQHQATTPDSASAFGRDAEDGDRFDVRGLVRVGAPAKLLEAACQAITETAGSAGAKLFRLDGEHAPAVYATAPTGGGPL